MKALQKTILTGMCVGLMWTVGCNSTSNKRSAADDTGTQTSSLDQGKSAPSPQAVEQPSAIGSATESAEVVQTGDEDITGEALKDSGENPAADDMEKVIAELPPPPASMGEGLKQLKIKAGKSKGGLHFPQDMWVMVDALNVRSGPSPAAGKVGKLSWGEKVEVLGLSGAFARIGDGRFVLRRFLTDRKTKFVPVAH